MRLKSARFALRYLSLLFPLAVTHVGTLSPKAIGRFLAVTLLWFSDCFFFIGKNFGLCSQRDRASNSHFFSP